MTRTQWPWLRWFRRESTEDATTRTLYINDRESNAEKEFPGNRIRTTKYTWYTFLPRGLFEQFRRVANLYFLFHMLLTFTPITPVSPATAALPLVFVVGVAMLKELWEDIQRGRSDYKINRSKVDVMDASRGDFIPTQWMDVQVGDIVRVSADSSFPADLVCIKSSLADGSCHVETMNLDGETNLKLRRAVSETAGIPVHELGALQGTVECEEPNMSIYTFVGKMVLAERENPVFLQPAQMLLRGAKLRNTEWVVGVAVYTGRETKVMMNAIDPPSKRSFIERRLDVLIIFQLIILLALCLGSAVSFSLLLVKYGPQQWYWQPSAFTGPDPTQSAAFNYTKPWLAGFLQFLTSTILYGYFVPISLYVSIEVVKLWQADFIRKDLHMFYEEKGIPVAVRTSNLNEELGMVNCVLSDKTGTLTRNQMDFFKCSIAGVSYGTGVTEVEKAAAELVGKPLPEFLDEEDANGIFVPEKPLEKGFNMRDPRLDGANWLHDPNAEHIRQFLEVLAVCQTVVVGPWGGQEPDPDTVQYMAESPDEAAFVVAAKRFGFFFVGRRGNAVLVRVSRGAPSGGSPSTEPEEVEYELLNTLAFTSHRKRMSVVVRDPRGRLLLLTKGADSVLLSRLAQSEDAQRWREATERHMVDYAEAGLRTLAIAYKFLDEDQYKSWQMKWAEAQADVVNAEAQAEKLEGLAEELEKDLVLLGATGIEDKLQVGVPQTIEKLAQAGIKVWVLTGDKLETAINIGYACNLLRHHMAQHLIFLEDNESAERLARAEGTSFEEFSLRMVERQIAEAEQALQRRGGGDGHGQAGSHGQGQGQGQGAAHAVVVDGKSLALILAHESMRLSFLRTALQCDSVICCRVSPKQKAQVTELVRVQGQQRCLAVGDGANDVGMIQKANIGVGIAGEEGQQAVMASDLAIGQFRFLERLLLVHGGWCYKRLSFMITYFFYKSFVFGFTVVFYNVAFALCSGSSVYYEWYLSLYQVVFTSLPLGAAAILDQDVKAVFRIRFPALYKESQQNMTFSWKRITAWLSAGLLQAVVAFGLVVLPMSVVSPMSSGRPWDTIAVGTVLMSSIIITVNLELLLAVQYLTWIHHVLTWGSILIWFLFITIGSSVSVSLSKQLYGTMSELGGVPAFYLVILLTVAAMLVPTVTTRSIHRYLDPMDYHIVQEISKLESKRRWTKHRTMSRTHSIETESVSLPPPGMARISDTSTHYAALQGPSVSPTQVSKDEAT